MDVTTFTTIVQDYGFPTVTVFFLAYFIWFLWKYITTEITPKLSSTLSISLMSVAEVELNFEVHHN